MIKRFIPLSVSQAQISQMEMDLLTGCCNCGIRLCDGGHGPLNDPHQVFSPDRKYVGVICGTCFKKTVTQPMYFHKPPKGDT